MVAPALIYLYCVLTWRGIFGACTHTFALRERIFLPKAAFREEVASRYIGFQVAHSTVALCILLGDLDALLPLIVLILAAPIYRPRRRRRHAGHPADGVVERLLGVVWRDGVGGGVVLVPMLFQIFCNRFIFFRRSWIPYRPLYALYDYNMIFANALIGFVQTLARINMLFFMFVLFFARLDKTLMPAPVARLGLRRASSVYIAMWMDHWYNNPVMMVFTTHDRPPPPLPRAAGAAPPPPPRARRAVVGRATAADGGGDGGGGEPRLAQQRRRQAVLARWQTAAQAALDAKRLRSRRARTRWRSRSCSSSTNPPPVRKQALRDAAALLRWTNNSVAERSIRGQEWKGDRADAAATAAGILAVGSSSTLRSETVRVCNSQ